MGSRHVLNPRSPQSVIKDIKLNEKSIDKIVNFTNTDVKCNVYLTCKIYMENGVQYITIHNAE